MLCVKALTRLLEQSLLLSCTWLAEKDKCLLAKRMQRRLAARPPEPK